MVMKLCEIKTENTFLILINIDIFYNNQTNL